MPCHAHCLAKRCHARRTALCTSLCTRPHVARMRATFRCTPIPYHGPAVRSRPFCCFPMRALRARRRSVLSPSLADPPTVPVDPLAGLCSFAIPLGFGRPRNPWPTCRCALRCARTAATQRTHGTTGYAFGYSSGTKAEGTLLYSRGTPSSGYTATREHTRDRLYRGVLCRRRQRAPPVVLLPARACAHLIDRRCGAGARAARDGAARAESPADGRCRWAARGARGGAALAAVGAARNGLRGDRDTQGACRGNVRAFRLHGP